MFTLSRQFQYLYVVYIILILLLPVQYYCFNNLNAVVGTLNDKRQQICGLFCQTTQAVSKVIKL